ncbi:purine and uridine phosphorylase, partial [Ascobolus immersus RN42]
MEPTDTSTPRARNQPSPSPYNNDGYTVGWICALTVEQAAGIIMFDVQHGRPRAQHRRDNNVYKLGEIAGHLIAIACIPAGTAGTNAANTVANHMLMSFPNIRFGLLVGIGGGIPNPEDVRLGDVVVSIPTNNFNGVVHYSKGRVEADGPVRTGQMDRPPQILLSAVNNLRGELRSTTLNTNTIRPRRQIAVERRRRDFGEQSLLSCFEPGFLFSTKDLLFPADYHHQLSTNSQDPNKVSRASRRPCRDVCDLGKQINRPARMDTENPEVHYGLIASGDWLVRNSEERERIRRECGALCIEMEAAGLQGFPSLVIRGISDYADSHKSDDWHAYAALTASAYARELLQDIVPDSLDNLRSV